MATPPNPAKRLKPKARFNWVVSDFYPQVAGLETTNGRRNSAGAATTAPRCTASRITTSPSTAITRFPAIVRITRASGRSAICGRIPSRKSIYGPMAQKFRDELAKGKMPIPTCARCGDLKRLAARASQSHAAKPRLPHRGMLLENTVRCNVDCTGCARENAAGLAREQAIADAAGRDGEDGRPRCSAWACGSCFI